MPDNNNISANISIVDLTDSRSLRAYITTSNRRQVIYNPNTGVYLPNYGTEGNTLYPEMYLSGNESNIIGQAESVKWEVQTNSMGRFNEVEESDTYQFGNDGSLIIQENILADNLSMLFRVNIIYYDSELDSNILIQADIELVKITSGADGNDGKDGRDGQDGIPGVDGSSSYTHVAYADNATGTVGFTFTNSLYKAYVGIYVDDNQSSSTDPSLYSWTLIKGADGSRGEDGTSSYTHVAWANNATGTNSFSTSDSTNKVYLGIYSDSNKQQSEEPSDYHWTRIKGDQGEQGVRGEDGKDGEPRYTWIRYADTATGGGISNSPTGKKYIGIANNQISAQESNDPDDYTWSLIKGEDGQDGTDGIPGRDGEDGETTYTWIRYSPNADGSSMTNSPNSNTQHIGIATNKTTPTESDDPDDYTWSKFIGDDGESSYTWIRYSQNSNGSGMVSNPSGAIYMGVAVTNSSTPPSSSGAYQWSKIAGDNGVAGPPGTDGQTPYTHFAYANRNDAGNIIDFSTSNPENRQWLGQYTDYTEASSTSPSDYTWVRITRDPALLFIINTPDGTSIRNSEGNLTLESELLQGTTTVTANSYRWYKRMPNASGDSWSGSGWSRLSSSNDYGTSGYNTRTLTLTPDSITGSATYLVIADVSGTRYRVSETVEDFTDPYTVSILGNSVFKNGGGTNKYLAKVYRNGNEVDLDGTQFEYEWHQYNSSGDMINGFMRVGKEIEISDEDFYGQGDLRVTVLRGGVEINDNWLTNSSPANNTEINSTWSSNATYFNSELGGVSILDTVGSGGRTQTTRNIALFPAGEIMTSSGYLYVNSETPLSGRSNDVYVRAYRADGSILSDVLRFRFPANSPVGEPIRFEVTDTTPTGADTLRASIALDGTGDVTVTNWKLEEGSQATRYRPHPTEMGRGVNLLRNSSFATMSGWSSWGQPNGQNQFSHSPTGWSLLSSNGRGGRYQRINYINFKPWATYTVSCRARGQGTLRLAFEMRGGGSQIVQTFSLTRNEDAGDLLSFSFKGNPSIITFTVYGWTDNTQFNAHSFKIEESTIPTPWTPAPEDD